MSENPVRSGYACSPAPSLRGQIVETAFERGWAQLENGAVIQAAESAGFERYVTTDKNLKYQQNLAARRIAIAVLWTASWPQIQLHADAVVAIVLSLQEGEFREFDRPA